ncbi:MAG: isoprenylcysteine carboxylmethyltransferase family protein [Vicinamibacterales bacterium]
MPVSAIIACGTLAAVLAVMAGEAALSAYNASVLRARGALEPPGDVYRTMQWAYPAGFVALAVEGGLTGPAPAAALAAGLVVFGLAKALKAWAMATLGWRWSFRVLVPPGLPLVATGPYRLLRHPNYVAVIGEIVGAAAIVHAPVSGVLFLLGFGWLLWRRVTIEDRALGRDPVG